MAVETGEGLERVGQLFEITEYVGVSRTETLTGGRMIEPAFPQSKESARVFEGLSIRDYFAAQALNGIISFNYDNGIDCANYVEFAEYSYKYADSMLEARKK